MADAGHRIKILALAVAGCLLPTVVYGQAPEPAATTVIERPPPGSAGGELGEADVARAAAMIRDLGTAFGALAAGEADSAVRNDWLVNRRIYHRAANRLSELLAAGRIAFRDLPAGAAAAIADGSIVVDATLAGRWQPEVVRRERRLGAGDWADISRLADELIAQLAQLDSTAAWSEWMDSPARAGALRKRISEAPGRDLQPLLLRYWHLQDKFIANALAPVPGDGEDAGPRRSAEVAALSNDVLGLLRQVEDIAGWRWRAALEGLWSERQAWARTKLAAAQETATPIQGRPEGTVETAPTAPKGTAPSATTAPVPASPPVVSPPGAEAPPAPGPTAETAAPPEVTAAAPAAAPAAPPRSADFDELFTDVAEGAAEPPAAGAGTTQDLTSALHTLSRQVEVLAAGIAEQRRDLALLADDVAAAGTAAEGLMTLSDRQAAVERRIADLAREVGPEGLPRKLAELAELMESTQSRSRESARQLETQVEERLRALSRDIDAARRQAADVRADVAAVRPSATAVEVRLDDAAQRSQAFRQVVGAGIVLFVLLAVAIALWRHGRRVRGQRDLVAADVGSAATAEAKATSARPPHDGELDALTARLQAAERNALRDELAQLRSEIESERSRAGDLEERLAHVNQLLLQSQARAERLEADLKSVRKATQSAQRGVRDSVARDEAMGSELARLDRAIAAEHERAAALQALIGDIKKSTVPPALRTTPSATAAAPAPQPSPPMPPPMPPPDDATQRRRAIEALHRSDLPGFEGAFARLAALPLEQVRRIVRAPGGRELALACRAVEIAKPHFAAALILSRGARTSGQRLEPRDLAAAMAAYDETAADSARDSLQLWRTQAAEVTSAPTGEPV